MILEQNELDKLASALTEQELKDMQDDPTYQEMKSLLDSATSNPLLIQPASFLIVKSINKIRGFSESDGTRRMEESSFEFLIKTNKDLSTIDKRIKDLIASGSTKEQLFELLVMLNLLYKCIKAF